MPDWWPWVSRRRLDDEAYLRRLAYTEMQAEINSLREQRDGLRIQLETRRLFGSGELIGKRHEGPYKDTGGEPIGGG